MSSSYAVLYPPPVRLTRMPTGIVLVDITQRASITAHDQSPQRRGCNASQGCALEPSIDDFLDWLPRSPQLPQVKPMKQQLVAFPGWASRRSWAILMARHNIQGSSVILASDGKTGCLHLPQRIWRMSRYDVLLYRPAADSPSVAVCQLSATGIRTDSTRMSMEGTKWTIPNSSITVSLATKPLCGIRVYAC